MPRAEVRAVEPGDPLVLSMNLRQADINEIEAAFGPDLDRAIEVSLEQSTSTWAGIYDGELACLMGVGPANLLTCTGRPWLLATPVLDAHPVSLGRLTARYLGEMLADYPHLENWVDARHFKAVSWLSHLGFYIHDPIPFGRLGLPFHRFEMGS